MLWTMFQKIPEAFTTILVAAAGWKRSRHAYNMSNIKPSENYNATDTVVRKFRNFVPLVQ